MVPEGRRGEGERAGTGVGAVLSPREREEIALGVAQKESYREIGRRLGRPASTVSREVAFDCWQSPSFVEFLDGKDIDGLVICGVELVCCVLYAVLGAAERGYHYMVPQDLVSGQDPGDETGNKAVRDFRRFNHPEHAIELSEEVLSRWRARTGQT